MILLATSLQSLQILLSICERYVVKHSLQFSTDKNPSKCKTKCMAFLRKPRELPSMILCGDPLPWVQSAKHLGLTINTKSNLIKQDLREKRGMYVARNSELLQVFGKFHRTVVMHLNQVYNMHMTSSPVWNLFSSESESLDVR